MRTRCNWCRQERFIISHVTQTKSSLPCAITSCVQQQLQCYCESLAPTRVWCTSWQLQEGQQWSTHCLCCCATYPQGSGPALSLPCVQDPPAEEYDQMLAFYYKWQEKEKVRLSIIAFHWHHDTVLIFCPRSANQTSDDMQTTSDNLA